MPTKKRQKDPDLRQSDFLHLLSGVMAECRINAPVPAPANPDPSPLPGLYDDNQRVRRHLNALIKASGVDRETLAARMSRLTGKAISKTMIDSWTGAGRPNAFPLQHLRAFVRACDAGSSAEWSFLSALMDGTGWSPMDAARARLVELGQYAGALLHIVTQITGLSTALRGGRA